MILTVFTSKNVPIVMEISGYFEMLFTGLEKYEDIICILKAYGKSVVKSCWHTQLHSLSWYFIGQRYGNIKSS